MWKFMKNKILIPLVIVAGLAAFFSFRYAVDEEVDSSRSKLIIQMISNALEQNHFAAKDINDSFSQKVYNRFLERMDYDKRFLTQEDIDALSKYEFRLDDEINNGTTEFYTDFIKIYNKGIDKSEEYCKEILEKSFNFSKKGTYTASNEDLAYPKNEKERKARWHDYLKYRTLAKYVDLKDNQEKRVADKDTSLKEIKSEKELEIEARESISKSMDYFFKRVRKLDSEDKLTLYINSITNTQDPHTDYLPPQDKERFDEMMSGSFFGIGARLQDKEGRITIVEVIAGSPCWKQGDLKAGDEIIKVAQGSEEPVDIQGYDINDAVKIIRGPKDTEVRLTVKKVSGAIQEIPIIRGKVLIEETFARSAIINSEVGSKIGYIYLPDFYADFNNSSGRRCAEDVAIEVMKLKRAKVDGIILDLRYNGGGSLNDVISMAGLFIDEGPIVQVRTSHSAPATLKDRQAGTLYDGPLAIMINHSSASASEIMAAAMQDYKRAIIVGTTSFGKGTVQKILSLDDYMRFVDKLAAKNNKEPLGSLKLTIQKFYRANGGSTQLRGVTPDIIFPDPYEHLDMGERKDKAALAWDEIPAADYKIASNPVPARKLAELSYERINNNETFKLIKDNALRIKEQDQNKTYSLNEDDYRERIKEGNDIADRLKELEEESVKLSIVNPKEDLPKVNLDSNTTSKNEKWLEALSKDIYLAETVNILNDMQKLDMNVDMNITNQ